jgi:O-antigen/teichoic acid export membrane protein
VTDTTSRPVGSALARNAFFLMLAQGVSTTMAVVLSGAVGRTLGPAEFGLFFLVSSMGAFAYVIADWGQEQYVTREVAKAPERAGGMLGTILGLRIAAAALLSGLMALTARGFGYDPRTCGLAALAVGIMLPFFLAQAHNLVFRARERMEYDALVSVVDRSLTLGLTLLALAAGLGLTGALLAQGLGGVGALLTASLLLRHLGVQRRAPRIDTASEVLRGGASMALLNTECSAQTYLDPFLLSKLGPPAPVGWLGAARSIAGTLIAPAIILGVAAYPRLSRAAADRTRFRIELRTALRPTFALASLACVGTYLLATPAVAFVYDAPFAPAGTLLQVLAPGLVLLYVDNVLVTAVMASGSARPLVIAKVVNILAVAGLATVLVPYFQARTGNGAIGLALASTGSELIILATALTVLPAGSLDPMLLLDLGRALLAGAGTLGAFLLLPPVPLFAGVAACTIAFALLAFAVGLIGPRDLALLKLAAQGPAEAGSPAAGGGDR